MKEITKCSISFNQAYRLSHWIDCNHVPDLNFSCCVFCIAEEGNVTLHDVQKAVKSCTTAMNGCTTLNNVQRDVWSCIATTSSILFEI